MRLSSDLSGIEQVRHFTRKDGLPNEESLRVAEFQGQLRFLTSQGFYRFSKDHRSCVPDQDFNFLIKDYVDLPCLDASGRLWCMAGSAASIITPNPHGSPKVDTKTLARLQDFTIVNDLRVFGNGVAFFTTSNGFAVYVPSASPYNPVTFATLIRSVENMRTQRIIFEGAPERLPQGEGVILPFKQNALRFNFALPSFVYQAGTIFRHHLDGLDRDWSKWDKKTEKEFNNLPFGRYKFRVQARDYQGTPGRIAVFAFTILPPWYRTWWAYILWVIGSVSALVGIIYLYTLKLRREKAHLENIVSERTQQLRDASLTDPLTGLRNRRFIAEVLQNDIAAFIGLKNFQLNTKNQRRSEEGDSVFGLFLFDIDFFKKVNDTYGHDAGDRVLKQFAAIITGSVRQDDAVMRVGGEEFLVMLKKTQPEYLPIFAAKVLKKVTATPFDIGGGTTIQKTCSIGYTSFPFYKEQPGLLTFEQCTMIADMGLFQAKNHGRNQGVYMKAGPRIPSGEEIIQKTVTSLEFALQEGYLQIGDITNGQND
jgi:diguanylate cyclase (GGDEF)-like protein